MPQLSISKAWDETKAILARDGRLLGSVAAALFLLPQVIVGLATGQTSNPAPGGTAGLLMLLAGIVGLVGQLAVVRLAVGRTISVGEAIRHGLRRLPTMLLALILVLIAVAVFAIAVAALLAALGTVDLSANPPRPSDVALVMVILAVPFLLLAVRLLPLVAVVSEEGRGPIVSLKRSWALTAGKGWRLLGFIVMFIVGALVLTLAVAMVATVIVKVFFGAAEPFTVAALILALFGGAAQAAVTLGYVLMIARIYVQLSGESAPSAA